MKYSNVATILLLLPFLSFGQIPKSDKINDQAIAAFVSRETLRSWNAYKTYAWKHDELKPLSKQAATGIKTRIILHL